MPAVTETFDVQWLLWTLYQQALKRGVPAQLMDDLPVVDLPAAV